MEDAVIPDVVDQRKRAKVGVIFAAVGTTKLKPIVPTVTLVSPCPLSVRSVATCSPASEKSPSPFQSTQHCNRPPLPTTLIVAVPMLDCRSVENVTPSSLNQRSRWRYYMVQFLRYLLPPSVSLRRYREQGYHRMQARLQNLVILVALSRAVSAQGS